MEKNNSALSQALNDNDKGLHCETSLVFSGDLIKVAPNSSPSSMVSNIQDVSKRELKCTIPTESIQSCKKFGPKNLAKKSVIISFSNMAIRNDVYSKSIQKKKTGLYVNEFLTRKNSKLLYDLRQIKREFEVEFSIFSRSGIACARLQGPHEIIQRMFNDNDIKKFRGKIARINLDQPKNDSPHQLRRSQRNK